MVTNLNPLKIWFWQKPYVRFSAADYNAKNLKDVFIHLTNNSIGKYVVGQTEIGTGNMWFCE
jgi:hypothetical protein